MSAESTQSKPRHVTPYYSRFFLIILAVLVLSANLNAEEETSSAADRLRKVLYIEYPPHYIEDFPTKFNEHEGELAELKGPSPEIAAVIIRKALTNQKKSPSPILCAKAILNYRVFDEGKYLLDYIEFWREHLKRQPLVGEINDGTIALLLRWLALFSGDDPKVQKYCKAEVWRILDTYPPFGSVIEIEQNELSRTLLDTLWLVKDVEGLKKIHKVSNDFLRNYRDKYPTVIKKLSETHYPGGIVSSAGIVSYPKGEAPKDEQERIPYIDRMLGMAESLLDMDQQRSAIEKLKGVARCRGYASFIFENSLSYDTFQFEWAVSRLLQEPNKAVRSRMIREALKRALKKTPVIWEGIRLEAYDLLTEYGDGLNKREKEIVRQRNAEEAKKNRIAGLLLDARDIMARGDVEASIVKCKEILTIDADFAGDAYKAMGDYLGEAVPTGIARRKEFYRQAVAAFSKKGARTASSMSNLPFQIWLLQDEIQKLEKKAKQGQ